METWKPVEGYEKYLMVSDRGQVKRLLREYVTTNRWGNPHPSRKPERICQPWIGEAGYLNVAIKIGEKRKKLLVHRLVAKAFITGYSDGLTVNHINGNKLDNSLENLEWVTLSDNTRLQWQTGLADLRGEKQPTSKLTVKQVRVMRKMMAQGISANAIAIVAGVNPTTVYYIRDRKRWASVA